MDSNGCQRKRGGRVGKNVNSNEKIALQNTDRNEAMDVSAVAISPTLEESGGSNNAPTSECRRSSRKKIIKFDVRDLLNKNRKTHKIQIEARIDSNAPTTSKAAIGKGIETVDMKSSTTSREAMLSKHKTFLEKSAIFRRYSVSQENKPPPPPLPIPPLLGKKSECKDSFSGTTSSHEFLSHAMIKPKQPTSLIVAQIESNTPTVTSAKRKNVNKTSEVKTKCIGNSETTPVALQKKRGRPSKVKAQTSVETVVNISLQHESSKRRISPEKAKNWKEYKACLAQQSTTSNEETQKNETETLTYYQKDDPNIDDISHSDISRSDDDGNFSGFQTSKDDMSCDFPLLSKMFSDKGLCSNETLDKLESREIINNEPNITLKEIECTSTPIYKTRQRQEMPLETEVHDTKALKLAAEKNKKDTKLKTSKLEQIVQLETGNVEATNPQEGELQKTQDNEKYKIKFNFTKKTEITKETETICIKEVISTNKNILESDEFKKDFANSLEVPKYNEKVVSKCLKSYTNEPEKIQNESQKSLMESEKLQEPLELEKDTTVAYTETSVKPTILDTLHETRTESITSDVISKSTSISSSSSRNSSSSESENFSERSFYSSSSSSSPRSYKSGDKLKVSVKRISLPKSPSTSSQTSTSEEFNNSEALKRKPPSGNRSKRLQKKFVETPKNESAIESIEYFQEIPIDESKLEIKIQGETGKNINEQIFPPAKNVIEESIAKFTAQEDSYESSLVSEITHSVLNESSHKEKIVRKKTFRNRKDNSSYDTDGNTNKPKYKEKQTQKEIDQTRQSLLIIENETQHKETHSTDIEAGKLTNKKLEISQKEDIEKTSGLSQSDIHETPCISSARTIQKQIQSSPLSASVQNLPKETITQSDKMVKSTNMLKEVVISKTGETVIVKTNEAEEKEAELTSKRTDLNIQDKLKSTDLEAASKVALLKLKNKNEEVVIKKPINHEEKPVKSTEELSQKELKMRIPNKDEPISQLISQNKNNLSSQKLNIFEKYIESEANKINNEEKLQQGFMFLDRKVADIELRCIEPSRQCSERNISQEEKLNSEIKEVAIPEITQGRVILPYELSVETDNEVGADDLKVGNKNTSKEIMIYQELSSANKILEENLKFREKDRSIKELSAKKQDTTMSLVCVEEEQKIDSKESDLIDECTDADEFKNITISQKEETSAKELIREHEYQTHSVEKGKVNAQNESKNAVAFATTDKSELDKKDLLADAGNGLKDNAQLSKSPLESENFTEKIKDIGTGTKTLSNKSPLPFIDKHSTKINSSTKNKESKKETSPLTAKIIACKKGASSSKATSSSGENPKNSTTKVSPSSPESAKSVIACKNGSSSSTATSSSGGNPKNSTTEVSSSSPKKLTESAKSFRHTNSQNETLILDQDSQHLKLHSSEEGPSEVSLLISFPKTTPFEEIGHSKIETDNKSRETVKANDTAQLITETCTSNSPQENKERHLEVVSVPKRRGRKARFKNLHGPEIEFETDSSNGNNTSIDEVIQQQQQMTLEVKDQEIKQPLKFPEIETKEYKNEKDVCQKDAQANLFSSQIKNVSIETNTLLDILRTVQSNTEAALKASKSPINVEKNQEEHDTSSLTLFDSESPLTCRKSNFSPSRSDTASPSILKKVTLSPTRSNSSSPLTLKKVTRRYERRSRRTEDSTHKTLEETFAEIAAQSSKAVLAAKEFDFNEEQIKNEKSQKELNDDKTEQNLVKEQINENVIVSETSELGEVDFNDKKVDNTVLNISQNLDMTSVLSKEEHIHLAEDIVEADTAKITPTRRGRKPKNRPLEVSSTAKESPDTNNLPKSVEEEFHTIENSAKVIEIHSEIKEIVNEDKDEQIKKPEKGDKTIPIQDLSDANNLSNPSQAHTEDSSKPLEDKSILFEKSVKKSITEAETDSENTLLSNIATCPEKEARTEDSSKPLEDKSILFKKSVKKSITEAETDSENTLLSNIATCIEKEAHTEDSSKPLEDKTILFKKSVKKSITEAETDSENTLLSNIATCPEKESETQTHKQPVKKRDSSLNKNENKSVDKNLQRKAKTEEEVLLNILGEETLTKTTATTPPSSKRGRKPKSQQIETPPSDKKKKNKKDILHKTVNEDINVQNVKISESDSEILQYSSEKSLDEKLAKKSRQKKLKEAFEAALLEDKEKYIDDEINSPKISAGFGLTLFNNSPPPEKSQPLSKEEANDMIKATCITPVEPEEDLDPLKDIEKFIADGVNLLKKDYKLDEDTVDDVIQSSSSTTVKILDEPNKKAASEEMNQMFSTFETPADTPINTPSVTPPPKSPTSTESSTPDENSGVRRSHRIKLITKTPKALVGRGLVRDRERFSIKDDVETKTHYSMDDHLTDLAEVEAKNAKFLKEMEERLSNFQVIKENDYLCERVISREARKMICDCFLTHEEEGRGELGCGEDCLNRLLMIECGPECNVKERCTNRRFQKLLCSPCRVFRTEKKGFGIMADIEILPGEFIMEYVGEVIDTEEFEKRRVMYSLDKNRHYYFMALRSDAIIDATIKGNISRFINHSCDPNAETQKWTVNGELRIGFFSRKSIMPGEEITFNYQYQRYGREAQRCYCESVNCRGWIGQEPTSDEGEQLDDEDDESEDEEEEEADTSNLLVQDEDDDSDASVADPEEVQKQLEMAAAQAEVELAPLQLLEQKTKQLDDTTGEGKSLQDLNKSDNDEDSKSKFKKLLSKMAKKVADKQKQNKREQKLQRKKKSKESSSELTNKLRFLEDPDIEDEVGFLKECGLKNQSDTLRLSRLMVRAKLVQTRLNLLEILRKGDFPCRRLFLDYHGLRLLHGWMSEDAGNMQIRLSLLLTLETLPIANKTVLTDSKVMQVVRNWCGANSTNLSPNDDSSSSNSNSQDDQMHNSSALEESSEMVELRKLALKLITAWEGLPEIFRIPKKERIEQMKEHEREADRQYAANAETQENTASIDRYRRDRFGRGLNSASNASNTSNRFVKPNSGNSHKTTNTTAENVKNLSKAQRREMFAAKVARDEAEKRLAEERREFETKCRFFGLDPKKTRTQDIPFCVNPSTGQWYSVERKPITTPPSYAHVQVPIKPKSTDPNDYQLPAICSTLPTQWKYAITPQGKIYFYHFKYRIPQWEPPSPAQIQQCELEAREEDSENELTTTAGEDSSDDDDDILIGMDAAQLKAYIDRKVETRRQKRYQRLVDERPISPRREEDRIYNQIEVRKYKENKEKIRKRKEDIRRKRAEALRQTSLNMCTLGSITETNPNTSKLSTENDEKLGALPIQDYLLSSDEEIDIKAEVNSPLIDKIVEGDKIVDELDALTTKRQLKRPLPPHRDLSEPSTSSSASTSISSVLAAKQEYKKRKLEKKEKRKPKEQDAKYRKNKEKFRCEIAGIIVHHLKPYMKETCTLGRIQSNEDFNHLARKLTHFVMIKELKYCESVGQTLVVTESVKSKSREFIKKYMAKYGDVYIKPSNDPDFKDIPFTL